MKKRSLPLSMRCPGLRERFSLRSTRRHHRRTGKKRLLKRKRGLSEDSAVNSGVKIAGSEHASARRMFVCDSEFSVYSSARIQPAEEEA